MATLSLAFSGTKDPYFPSDNVNGGSFTSRRSNAQVLSGAWFCASDSVWSCDVDHSNTFSTQIILGTANSNSRGITIQNSSGNGWLFLANNSSCRVFAMAAWVLSGSPLFTYTSTFATGSELNIDATQSTGTFVVKNGTTTIGTFVNTTYTSGLRSGITSRTGGAITGFTLTYTPARTVDTITDPVVLGSAISVGLTGYTNPTAVTGGGMSATGLSFVSNVLSAVWPPLSETLAPTVALPATSLTITVTEAGGSSTITADANLPAGYAATTFMSAIDDPRFLGGNITLTDGWLGYLLSPQAGVGNVEVGTDGGITADNAGVFVMHLHKLGTGLPLVQYNITINEAGDVVGVTRGITSSKVTGSRITGYHLTGSRT